MTEWLQALQDCMDRGSPCVLATVLAAKGSTPREAGVKMLVTRDDQTGTIGGGNLEFQAAAEARKLLSENVKDTLVKDYPLGPGLDQCCGGHVSVLFEPFLAAQKNLLLFGAGHVGREVVKVLEGLPFKITWVDERAEMFPDTLPKNCRKIVTDAPAAEIGKASEGAYIVIMTHSHNIDFELTRAALEWGKFSYLGLIGSNTKRARFEKRLKAFGIVHLERLTSPIGLPGPDGKHPREIAISLAAQLLGLENAACCTNRG